MQPLAMIGHNQPTIKNMMCDLDYSGSLVSLVDLVFGKPESLVVKTGLRRHKAQSEVLWKCELVATPCLATHKLQAN